MTQVEKIRALTRALLLADRVVEGHEENIKSAKQIRDTIKMTLELEKLTQGA